MKLFKRLICLLLLALGTASCSNEYSSNTHIHLGQWKFKLGDNADYAKTDYSDINWDSIKVNNYWENQKYDEYDGYAWYRVKVVIPSSIKTTTYSADSLKLYFGKIDDFDQVYLNGQIIGQNAESLPYGSTPDASLADTLSFSDKTRKYVISVNDRRIKWDRENVIAVRVYDPYDSGGLYSGIPYLGMVSLEDHLSFDKQNFYTLGSINDIYMDTSLRIKNISDKIPFKGQLDIIAKDSESMREVFNSNWSLKLQPGDSTLIPVSFPVTTDPLNVYFKYQDYNLNIQVIDTVTIPYVLLK